ncbi:MAG: hypothetical protein V1929_09740 [bacterium]
MPRNRLRKKNSSETAFLWILAVVLLGATTLALSYLWLCSGCDDLGRRLKHLEQQKLALQRRIVNEEYKWSNMTSPQNMEKLLQRHGLVMTWPSEKSIVRIRRSAAEDPSSPSRREYAQHTGAPVND